MIVEQNVLDPQQRFRGLIHLQAFILSVSEWRIFYVQGSFESERHLIEIENVQGYKLRPYACYVAMCLSQCECYVIAGPMASTDDAKYAKEQIQFMFTER